MNLLLDPIIRVRLPEQSSTASLPELLALLGADRVHSLPGVQRHQADALHIFLCYLAAAVLDREGETTPVQNADFWLHGIRKLTQADGCADDSAWTLVIDDPTRPAFLQPPTSSKAVYARDYAPKASSPDALDVLQTAKNHDLKARRGTPQDLEAWTFSLLSAQTLSGLLGKGSGGGMNRGISRMNSGYGSRPRVGWIPSFRLGAQFARDVSLLLQKRNEFLASPHRYQAAGRVLLWLRPWDGNRSYPLAELDPFFIEIARRYRLCRRTGPGATSIHAVAAGSAVSFIAAEQLKGNLGDPWIPINPKTGGALTVPASGLTPDLLRNLVFARDGFLPAAMQDVSTAKAAGWLCAATLVRGQGTTDGFHEAAVRLPARVLPLFFGQGPALDRLANLSKAGLEMAALIQYKALQPALFALLEGGPKSINIDKKEIRQWVAEAAMPFFNGWSPHYFDWLWTTPDQSDDALALRPWFEALRTLATRTLERAFARVPLRRGRTYRATTHARALFFGSLNKHFKGYIEEKTNHEPT